MKHTHRLATLLLSILLPALSACGGGNSSAPLPPAPKPITSVSYDLRSAVLQLYSKPHRWDLKGTLCCAGGSLSANLSLQPRPSDGSNVNFGGEDVSGVDVTLRLSIPNVPDSSSTAHLWYSAKGQQMMLNGLVENRLEITTSQGSLPTSAAIGDTGSNGASSTYDMLVGGARLVSTTSYRWELKQDGNARVLLCMHSVETPDPAYAGNNPALAASTTASACYGLNADSTLSGFVSLSKHGYINLGWDLSTQ